MVKTFVKEIAGGLREFVEKERCNVIFFHFTRAPVKRTGFLPGPTFHATSNIMSSPSQHTRTAPQTIANTSPTYR